VADSFDYILGVPNFANYEAAAALIRVPRGGGTIEYVTVGEDRLTRVKHTYAFPLRGIHYCLQQFGLESLRQVDYVCTDYARLPRWMNSGPGYRKLEHDYLKLRLDFPRDRIRVLDHHDGHAGLAFYPSGFDEAAVLIVDSLGSRLNTQTLYHATPDGLRVVERGNLWGIGRLYSLVTGSVLPYGPEKGFGKTMGLAPYGRVYPGPVLEFNGRHEGMQSDYSAFCSRPPSPRIIADGVKRCTDREQVLDPYFARAAYDVQQECERELVRLARYAHERTGSRRLCLSGGTALNGLANARVIETGLFDEVFIPPGCSDAGIALGLALWGYFQETSSSRRSTVSVSMHHAYTGRSYPPGDSRAVLDTFGITHRPVEPEDVAPLLANGQVVGWYVGGSEFGPRALGHRSILADPRDPAMKDTLNHRVKFREGYRPYAPSVLAEHAADWFDLRLPSPFMLQVVTVHADKRALVPAVTHVDDTTRPQTVTVDANPAYYRLIAAFNELTGVPMVLNTSLNVNREPIVETPLDALICAFSTAIDYLYLDGVLIDCAPYRRPELVQQLTAERARRLDEEWRTVTARYLTRYDPTERDAYLAEANTIAEWHRDYRAKNEIEDAVLRWRSAGTRVAIVGTRGHTRCLYEYIDDFATLDVRAFVPLDDRAGERAEFAIYPGTALTTIDWRDVDAVLISTHEYQHDTLASVQRIAPSDLEIVAPYDDAGDSLLHVLPGRWPVVTPLNDTATASLPVSVEAYDFESPVATRPAAERYALIINYHYCHPDEGVLKGLRGITPQQLDQQLRTLTQNFVCTTMSELLDADANLPETVAVLSFDDGLKDLLTHALPVLQRWHVPAIVNCCSSPLLERRILNVHRAQLLQARLGAERFQREFDAALAQLPPQALRLPEGIDRGTLYVYDDESTRRFKTRLNFELPDESLDAVLDTLFEAFIGPEADVLDALYLSIDDLRRCQDAGIEIGLHTHSHRVLSRLSEKDQRADLQTAIDFFRDRLGLANLHLAYPYGIGGTWNGVSVGVARDL
jgi:carbamoyltransferase